MSGGSRERFGIYVLTHPGDYHLSSPLVRSLRYFNPSLPITLVPGDGFEKEPYPISGLPVLHKPASFEYETRYGYDRKFWCFDGPYERFLYLDADVINLRPLDALVERVLAAREPFIFAQIPSFNEEYWAQWKKIGEADAEEQKRFHRWRIGNIENIRRFDPEFPFNEIWCFNGGLWASSRGSFQISWFNELRRAEEAFFRSALGIELSGNDGNTLFYLDQARLTYIAFKQDVEVHNLFPDGHYRWGGHAFGDDLRTVLDGQASTPFIHWAGVPRPSSSCFCRPPLFWFYWQLGGVTYDYQEQPAVPGLAAWRHFAPKTVEAPLKDTLKDVRRILLPSLKRLVLNWRRG